MVTDNFIAYAKTAKACPKCDSTVRRVNELNEVCCRNCGFILGDTSTVEVKEKSKRGPREIEVTYIAAGGPIVKFICGDYPVTNKRYMFREILPED